MKMKYKILKIKNEKEEVIGNNLELKEAYKILLDKFNELLSDKTRSFDYDGTDYIMIEDDDNIEDDVYRVEVEFKVKGYFEFGAADRYQAAEYAEKDCGAIFDNYQSSLPDADWNFPVHPEKKIKRITKIKK